MLRMDKNLTIWTKANTEAVFKHHESIRRATVDLFVFKKVKTDRFDHCIASLIIPKGTLLHLPDREWRGASHTIRPFEGKMRAEQAVVHSIVQYDRDTRLNGIRFQKSHRNEKEIKIAFSDYNSWFTYQKGRTVKPTAGFDLTDNACESGIHFFLHSDTALAY